MAKKAEKKVNARTTMSLSKAEMQKFKAYMQKKHLKHAEDGIRMLLNGTK